MNKSQGELNLHFKIQQTVSVS